MWQQVKRMNERLAGARMQTGQLRRGFVQRWADEWDLSQRWPEASNDDRK